MYFGGGLYPRQILLPPNAKVLDIGCGNGAWATDLARALPDGTVTGIDISPPPIDQQIPANCVFKQVDIQQPWTLPGETFDFIHIRYMMHVIHDWPALFSQCHAMLNPKGWLESDDFWAPYRSANSKMNVANSPFLLFGALFENGREQFTYGNTRVKGIDQRAATHHADRLRLAGFTRVETIHVPWPIGSWPTSEVERKMGELTFENYVGMMSKFGSVVLKKTNDIDDTLAQKVASDMVDELQEHWEERKYFLSM